MQRCAGVWVQGLKHNLAGDRIDPDSLLHALVVRLNRHAAEQVIILVRHLCVADVGGRGMRRGALHECRLTAVSSVRARPGLGIQLGGLDPDPPRAPPLRRSSSGVGSKEPRTWVELTNIFHPTNLGHPALRLRSRRNESFFQPTLILITFTKESFFKLALIILLIIAWNMRSFVPPPFFIMPFITFEISSHRFCIQQAVPQSFPKTNVFFSSKSFFRPLLI